MIFTKHFHLNYSSLCFGKVVQRSSFVHSFSTLSVHLCSCNFFYYSSSAFSFPCQTLLWKLRVCIKKKNKTDIFALECFTFSSNENTFRQNEQKKGGKDGEYMHLKFRKKMNNFILSYRILWEFQVSILKWHLPWSWF